MLDRFLRWRHARTVMQLPLFALAVAMILHGLLGPQLAPKNLATLLTWVHYRGVLVLVLLAAGNLFCAACPFMLVRDVARRFFKPVLHWPRRLRSKWLALGLFVLVLFSYELFDLWGSPWWTAWLILSYFIAALVVDTLFRNASFCKWVCPIGQFNFAASTLSPLEVAVREPDVCARCTTFDCIRGTRHPEDRDVIVRRGCELALFQPLKTGNMDCTFCLDCVQACPHGNVGLATRLPGSELWADPRRSGIGRFSKRKDLAALAILFTFGALLNAFGMVSPVYAFQSWLAERMGTRQEGLVLGTLFFLLLVLEPVLLLGLAGWLTRRGTGTREPLLPLVTRFAYALLPLGFGVWVAHYCFHLLTGLWTFVPVAQDALADLGLPWLGTPNWGLGGLPEALVYPLELGFLGLGLVGSLLVAYRIAERDYSEGPGGPRQVLRASAPWAGLCLLLWIAAMWLLSQPMEMRGTFLGS
ncbi:MAG TPA: 4Fe-4S binding protein [Thermoanaerobaculia bacterium]|nr:4Fe-4S binding protein [Thermoanaerobaculia bacterium]